MVAVLPEVEWQPRIVFMEALRVAGSQDGNMRLALGLMRAGRATTEQCITHTFPLDRIDEAFQTVLKREESLKVLVKPWDNGGSVVSIGVDMPQPDLSGQGSQAPEESATWIAALARQ